MKIRAFNMGKFVKHILFFKKCSLLFYVWITIVFGWFLLLTIWSEKYTYSATESIFDNLYKNTKARKNCRFSCARLSENDEGAHQSSLVPNCTHKYHRNTQRWKRDSKKNKRKRILLIFFKKRITINWMNALK